MVLATLRTASDAGDSISSIERYSRQMLAIDGGSQAVGGALKNGSALIIGAGGLGCPAAMYLVSCNVNIRFFILIPFAIYDH